MELRFIVICMSVFVLFSLYSTNAVSLTSILGDDITMSCFVDPGTDFFVDLVYLGMSSNTATTIAKYDGQSTEVAQVASQFTNRLEFSPLTSITLKNVRLEDEGTYKCVLRSFHAVGEPEISNSLEVYVRPTIEASSMNDPLTAGGNPVNAASCSARNGKPQPVVSWYTDRYLAFNQSKSSEIGTVPGTNSSYTTLYVTPTKFYNNQLFYCEILHPALPNGKNITGITLNVQYPPSTPTIDVINQNTQLECTSDGNPSPTIKWTMPNNNPSPDSDIVRIISPNDPARQNDTYLCEASNGISPSTSNSITTSEAVTYVEIVKQSNTGVIVGAVVGSIVVLLIIAALVYWFIIRKHREKDDGPYNPKKITRQSDDEGGWSRSSGRPMIQHANVNLNKNAPPSPTRPPPQDEDEEASNNSQSDVEEFTEGDDVDLNIPFTGGEEDEDMPTTGIVSKNSVNFQHRRQRPSTSPHRGSQHRGQPEPSPRTTQPSDPHYEVPPKEYYDDEYDQDDEGRLMDDHHLPNDDVMDNRFYDLPQDRYPGYQPRYDEPPHHEDNLPPYTDTIQYATIDHGYNTGKSRTRPPYNEPVEYAEIRSKGQIV